MRRVLSDAQEVTAVDEYLAGKSAQQVADMFGLRSFHAVYNALKKHTIKRRVGGFVALPVNHSAFANAHHNNEASYYVGLLMADGSIRGGKTIRLCLSGEDGCQVASFKEFIKSQHKLQSVPPSAGYDNAQPQTQLVVTSTQLAGDLARYGVVQNKTHTAETSSEMIDNPHFWRGVIDGDGWVSTVSRTAKVSRKETIYPVIGLVGARPLLEQFASFMRRHAAYRGNVLRMKNIWIVSTTGKKAVAVIRKLYTPSDLSLPRKAKAARQTLETYG